jgi:F-type H+-transporting ATPase subunit a
VEHPYLYFIALIDLFGNETLSHFGHYYPHVIYSWVVMAFLIISSMAALKTVTLIPGKGQNFFELFISTLEDFMISVTGEEGRWLVPLAGTVFIYILVCNLTGLIPGFFPPTASLNTTLSCALVVFAATHYIGIKYHGIGYIKHFLGPKWWLVPIFLPVEIIGHFSRVLSLSFRLFGNMMGKELVLWVLFFLAGAFLAPLPMMIMGIFVCFIQAFVFFLLTIMYFTGAMEHAH